MKIKNITLKNFRQYKDIELNFHDSHTSYDLNYIKAENGVGKTTLLNAITWCLYNAEKHTTKKLEDQTLPILTLDTLRNMEIGDNIESSVSITLSSSTEEVTFHRFIEFRKDEENFAYKKTSGQDVLIKKISDKTDFYDSEEEFNAEVSKRLPEKIQQFFFFDGEQLDKYLEGNTGSDVQEAVLGISQIDLLANLSIRLENVSKDMRAKLAEKVPKSKELNDAYNDISDKLIELEKELKTLINDNKETKSELVELTAALKNEPDIAELEAKREKLSNDREDFQTQLSDILIKLRKELTKYTFLLTALPKIRYMYDLIKNKEENNELPPAVDKTLLNDILKLKHCTICDRDLDNGSITYIQNLLEKLSIDSNTGILLTKIKGTLEEALRTAKKYKSDIQFFNDQRIKIEYRLKEIESEKDNIDLIIKKSTNSEQNKKDHEKLTYLEKLEPIQTGKIASHMASKINLEKNKKEIKEELDKAIDKESSQMKLRKSLRLAELAKDRIDVIIEKIKNDTRDKISKEMNNIFFELMWKKDFKKVELTKDYNASIINNDNLECLGSCSAAERELLVLAFTIALHRQSGFEGSLVIDTPISRISGDLRKSFATVLKKVSEEKQIILFMTKDEYSEQVQDVFESIVNCKFKFDLKNEDYVTVEEL